MTGVQTCALPISPASGAEDSAGEFVFVWRLDAHRLACDDGRRSAQRIFGGGGGACGSRNTAHFSAAGFAVRRVVQIVGQPRQWYAHMKMGVAICAAGVFYTKDGRRSWQPRNRGTRADFLPDRHPGFGQCVQKLLSAADGTLLCRLEHSDTCWRNSSRGCRDSRRLIR